MAYKYKRRQIFGKRLKVPKNILKSVYDCTLTLNDFIEYQLDGKIPTSCILEGDRKILEKFGIDKCKKLDWELINKSRGMNWFRNILMSIDSKTDDINLALYELIKDQIKPRNYSKKMSEIYADRLLKDCEIHGDSEEYLQIKFNDGEVTLEEMISNWDLFKNKDLSYCLLNDKKNTNHITNEVLKKFMAKYSGIATLVIENNNINEFINNLSNLSSDEAKFEYLKQFTDDILNNTYKENGGNRSIIKLTNDQYREIFKYSSMEDYLKKFSADNLEKVIKEFRELPEDYLFNIPINFSELLNKNDLRFINIFGLRNVVDFDNECGHFFTKNNCEMLKLMSRVCLFSRSKSYEIDRTYTKDEFYEAMRQMVASGPHEEYKDSGYMYRAVKKMTGEFRTRNEDLFISEQAPENLQFLFYEKEITPQLIANHPEYIQYLKGKNLNSCFDWPIQVEGSHDENLYKFISSKTDFNDVMNFITEYREVLDIVISSHELRVTINDNLDTIQDRINEILRKRIIEKGFTYPKHIPKKFIEQYPSMFLDENAPQELQEAFYNRKISPELILSNPSYIKYLKNIDLEVLFEYIPVNIVNEKQVNEQVNLVSIIKQKFDSDDAFDIILLYGKYIEEVVAYNDSYDKLGEFKLNPNFSKEDLLNEIDKIILQNIIKKKMKYDEKIHSHFKKNNPTLFLGESVPQNIKDKFYNRTITPELIFSNPSYIKYLKNIDLEVLFEYIPVNIVNEKQVNEQVNLVSIIKQKFDSDDAFDIILLYGKYIEKVFAYHKLEGFKLNQNISKEDFFNEMDKAILQNIIDGKINYDEKLPSHFKNNNPTLFLGENISQDIKDKFYNRQFTIKDFNDNPELFDIFDKTNIACGFSENMSWIIPLFNNSENLKIANYKRMKLILEYSKINDTDLKNMFKEYVMENENNIDKEKIEYISKVLARLSYSNSSEIRTFKNEVVTQILKSNNPLEKLNNIEDVFIKNNIPTVGKIYSCFEILHPDFQGFDFEKNPMVSPVLKNVTTRSKKIIVFSDLIKCAFGSNNRSVNAYLKNIDFGSSLYEKIKNGQVQFDSLGENEKQELKIFSKHLATLYNNTTIAKVENKEFKSSGDVLNDIFELSKKLSPDGTLDYNLADRAIRMFCWSTGIDTLDQAKKYIEQKIKTADSRNRNASTKDMTLEQGDFIKGINTEEKKEKNIKYLYLRNILQNGSVSKEYLGSDATSDCTPLDTDVSMILNSEGTIREKMNKTVAAGYGPIWFVLKNNESDNRFITTRTSYEREDAKRDMSKMEVFLTGGGDHYGIRTGFASSEINYIVMEDYDPKVCLEIAMNGFYIPVANKEGKIIFTPKDYDKLREKMSGLSYYGEDSYSFSENLVTKETEELAQKIEQSNYEVQVKREKINNIIKKSLEELGLNLKTNIDGDLTEGFVELIDTGSTGRGTNKPGDGDFDFMMRLDKAILSNSSKLDKLKQTILKNLGKENSSEITGAGDFRLKGVQIDNKTNVDIDITFTKKTDKIAYSTDMALRDRLATIKKIDPEKYKYVVANILLAKRVLKEAGAYKPNRGEIPQGGLGGVGIENWILQNGGSFIDAAKSFVAEAERKSFSEFQSTYQIWDFGDNHLAERNEQYPHDNFVSKNMSDAGYQRMVQALEDYLKTMEINQNLTEEIKK